MIEPRFRWRFAPRPEPTEAFLAAARSHGLSPRLAALLAGRGVGTAPELDAFFADPLAGLHDPALLPDAALVRDRVTQARREGEGILVFGDFDADGLTGLAILVSALRTLGCDAEPYVPSRTDEGHGLSLRAVETAAGAGRTLIVTVDCGTTSVAEIAAARERGIDVIVTDHHHVPATLPPAVAVVNAHRPDARYPDPRLAGSGIAFKIAQLLLADEPGGPEAALALTELAVIGAVADVTPILGENRAIARLGLERLRTAPRQGLAALLARANVAPSSVDLETISFAIAPRLNAAGRVGEAVEAARLLLATDPDEAAALADALESANLSRRELSKEVLAAARLAIVDGAIASAADGEGATAALRGANAVIVKGPWPVGIVGPVAARLAEETGLPAIVGAEVDGVVRASCRSGTLHLADALDACGELFIRYGGHRGAAGFELAADRWDEFRTRFDALAAVVAPEDPRPVLTVDLALPAPAVDYALLRELGRLAPTGPGNEPPLVGVLGLTVTRVREAKGGHTQLTLRRERDVVDGIAFNRDDLARTVREGDRIDVVARLASRSFNGFETLQLEIRDVAVSGAHPECAAILAGAPLAAVPMAVDAPAEVGA